MAQNEILKTMALSIQRKITADLSQSRFFCIIGDEFNISNRKQLVICIAAIRDILLRQNLTISKCRGQCYNGASTMKGAKNGVATQLLKMSLEQFICTAMAMP